jgi:hypothetical protein
MKNKQKGKVNIWLIVAIIIILAVVGYFVFTKKYPTTNQENSSVTQSTPSISLLSPVGGENWKIGSVQTIKWHTVGIPAGSQISISFASGGAIKQKGHLTVVSSKGEDDSWQFTVLNEVQVVQGDGDPSIGIPLPPGNYKIIVEGTGSLASVYGISNDFFTISK